MKLDTTNRIFGLDLMRAVAILLVLFSHTSILLFSDTESTIITGIRFFGAIGVDVFFVLSGFLIGSILLKQILNGKTKGKDMLHFLVRRWLRTLPNYYLILIVNILLVYFLHKSSLNDIPSFFLFIQNFTLGQIDFFTESWSLSIEEYAYIIGPMLLLLFFFLFNKWNKIKMFLWVTILIIVLVTVLRWFFHINEDIVDYSHWSHNLRKVVVYRLDSIYYGFLAAYIAMSFNNLWRKYKWSFAVIGTLLFIGMHGVIYKWNILPENASLFYNIFYLPTVSVSITMFLPIVSRWRKSRFLSKPITWISLLSYSIYLVNYSIILLTIKKYINIAEFSISFKLLLALVFWFITFILSYIIYRWFEKPIMNLRDKPVIINRFK